MYVLRVSNWGKVMHVRLVLSLVCFCSFFECAQGEDYIRRHKKIWEAAESNDWPVRIRAIQELAEIVEHNAPAQELLIRHLFADGRAAEGDLFEVVRVLAMAEPAVVDKLVSRYQRDKSGEEKLKRLLYVLGRMGPKAKPAIPFLLEELEKNRAEPVMEGCIRIVLANVGYESNENIATILRDIENRTPRGKSELWMMAMAGPQNWVGDDLVQELLSWFNQSYTARETVPLSVSLATLGVIDTDTQKRLGAFLRGQCNKEGCDEPACIYFGFCLAKSGVKPARKVLAPALRCLADDSPGFSLRGANVLVGDVLIGSDQRMLTDLSRMLDSRHPKVVTGALWMLLAIGLDARQYTPRVFKILKANPDEEVREVAAQTLGFLAGVGDIPELEGIIKKEESEFVREEIVKAIRIIRLEPQE
jgi:hypothetical protein